MRFVDATVARYPRYYIKAALGNLIGKSIEIKPLSQKGKTFCKLVEKAVNQNICNAFQVVDDTYRQYGGVGRNGGTSSLALTMASCQYTAVNLQKVGTYDATIDIQQGPNLAIFSRDTTLKLFGNNDELLKDSKLTFKEGKNKMQDGFLQLVTFLCTAEEVGPSDVQQSSSLCGSNGEMKITITTFLGAGAFCSVFAANVGGDKAALKILDHANVPRFAREQELSELHFQTRCERAVQTCIALRCPIGQTAGQYYAGIPDDPDRMGIDVVKEQVLDILIHSHSKQVVHLDVKPSNIIISSEKTAYLVDWGSAAIDKACPIEEFRGTPAFTHDELLRIEGDEDNNTKWPFTPKEEHDVFSLSLTIAVLLEKGKTPWNGFYSRTVAKTALEDRKQKALSILKRSKHDFHDLMAVLKTSDQPPWFRRVR
jgi:Protein kinase domain